MSWNEDTWEDVIDPPSSPTEDVSPVRDKTFFEPRQVQNNVDQNGHVTTGIMERNQDQVARERNSVGNIQGVSAATHPASNMKKFHPGNVSGDVYDPGSAVSNKTVVNENSGLYPDTDPYQHPSAMTATSVDPMSFKARVMSDGLNPKSRTSGKSGVSYVRIKSDELDKVGTTLPIAATSQGASHLLNSEQTYAHRQAKEELDMKSTTDRTRTSQVSESASVSSDQYSLLNSGNKRSIQDFTLHEYEKRKVPPIKYMQDTYSSSYSHYYSPVSEDRLSDDADTANVIMCLVFCVLGLGLMIGLIAILIHFGKVKEVKEIGNIPWEDSYDDFMNILYQGRVAEIIRSASLYDQEQLRQGTRSRPWEDQQTRQQFCDVHPPYLVGNDTEVNINITLHIDDITKTNSDVIDGGEWKPADCISRHRVAIIIPYRDRWSHLKVLLYYLIPVLKRQQIHFRLFVVEQFGNETFNKGRIMNAAFREALKLFDFQCVTFHDVDLLPEDDRNMYSCSDQPKHMSIGIDKFQYILPYENLVGGVLVFKTEHFELVNGYSNMYWGWGAEDDDMSTRILHHRLRIYRPPSNIARYKMFKHDGRKSSDVTVRMKLLRSAARRSKLEGLNNVQYKLLSTRIEKLFTHFIVDIGLP